MDSSFFKIKKLTSRITRICGIANELIYLVEGDKKAALIDTGVGLGNLRDTVKKLTDKPIIVLLTHGHVDHALAAGLFENVYMNPLDFKVYEENIKKNHRERFYDIAIPNWRSMVKKEDYIDMYVTEFNSLQDGDTFDLGGITVVAYELAGHTPGSMVFLLPEEYSILYGDACNTNTFLYDHNSCYVTEYRENLLALETKISGRYDTVYLSHGTGDAPKDLLESAIELTLDIINGRVDDVPFEFLGVKAYIAKKQNKDLLRSDGGTANIVYSKDKVTKFK
ncbi:MBL fold metallo-hydrolase [Hungatella hathewayi]